MSLAATSMTFLTVFDWLSPVGVEVSCMFFFALGFLVLRQGAILRRATVRKLAPKPKKFGEAPFAGPQAQLQKSLEAELSAGHAEVALKLWRAGKMQKPTHIETLKLVTQAFLEAEPANLLQEITEHIRLHREALCHARVVTALLDVLARSGHVVIMEEFAAHAQKQEGLQIAHGSLTYEVLLGGHASAGDEHRVRELFAEIRSVQMKITPRAYALTIKGFLKNGMVDAALKQILDMQMSGYFAPSFAVTQLLRVACEAGRCMEIYDQMLPTVQVPPEAVVLILEDALKRHDSKFALRVEEAARESKVPLLVGAYDSLLKLCAINADLRALELFEEMQKSGLRISEGLCVGLLSRCADSKFLRFAEAIACFVRGRDGMTIGVYSSLMKCYAYCGMYDKACDLYFQIRSAGLEPDSMMYGCLMKFAVECGRTELSRELFDKAPQLDIQNYMSLIRAAGRDKNVDRAFTLLRKMESEGMSVDIAAYNCVLDACVSAGDMQQARTLVKQMTKHLGGVDIITFNTLLKGYCSVGDIVGAKDLLKEMADLGCPPNDVSYNCLINAAASKGDFMEAWQILGSMEKSGVSVDHYTLSTMMKSLKRNKNMKYVKQALDLLDRTGINVCSDEVLFNTVLEMCIRHNQLQRLEDILKVFSGSTLRPCVHTYGSLIKACSTLKRTDHCWQLWTTMVDHRGMEPNDIVLGCMLDALVCNSKIDDAVDLFRKWEGVVKPNTVMYSTLIKGFTHSRQAARAMAMWKEMRDLNIPLNNVVYNSLIDAHARVGAMDEVSFLVEDMASHDCTPDMISYSLVVKGYCVKGDLDRAFEVFGGMQLNGMAVDCIIYNTILDGCTKHNRMDLADKIIDDMEKYDIKPSNFTLGILVKMYGRRRELDKAFEVLDVQAQKHGIQPNSQVRTCLMCACLNNHDFDRAFTVFEALKATPPGVDAKAYGALVSGISRNGPGRLMEAVELVKEAFGIKMNGFNGHRAASASGVETEVLEQLMRALGSQGMMPKVGIPLLEQLRDAGVPIGGRLCSSVLEGRK